MKRRRIVIAVVATSAAVGILLGSVLAGARRKANGRVYAPIQIQLADTPPQAGVIDIRAAAEFPVHPIDFRFMWVVHVRQDDPNTGRYKIAWSREYDGQAFNHPAGSTARYSFAERIEMPPGEYNVLVGLKDRLAVHVNEAGKPTAGRFHVATSRRFTVL